MGREGGVGLMMGMACGCFWRGGEGRDGSRGAVWEPDVLFILCALSLSLPLCFNG